MRKLVIAGLIALSTILAAGLAIGQAVLGADGYTVTEIEGRARTVIQTILDSATATGAGTSYRSPAASKTYQAYGRTSAGTGTAVISIEGSNDGTRWNTVTTTTLSLTSATLAVSAGMTSDDRYGYARANVTTLSGSTATVSVTRSY